MIPIEHNLLTHLEAPEHEMMTSGDKSSTDSFTNSLTTVMSKPEDVSPVLLYTVTQYTNDNASVVAAEAIERPINCM